MLVRMKVVVALIWLLFRLAAGSPLSWGSNPAEDSVESIEIIHPIDGALEKAPVVFKTLINLRPGMDKRFETQYAGGRLCIEVNTEIIHCSPLDEPKIWYDQLGNCTVRAYLTRSGAFQAVERGVYRQTAPITFTLVRESQLREHIAREIVKDDKKHRVGYLQSLVQWAQMQQKQPDKGRLRFDGPDEGVGNESLSDPMLIVGVRTAVVSHFPFRQAIRETWASPSKLPEGVKILFLGCRPYAVVPEEEIADSRSEESHLRQIWEAVELEKQVFGDLLTEELDCDDSYDRLADKTKEFLHFAATEYANAHYIMIADDDLYLRLDKIATWLKHLGPRDLFYSGHVRAIESFSLSKVPPNRDPTSRHYLTEEQYPLNELPPFALGANFFLSMDCARFVSKNRRRLRDLGGMDDISVALWLLSIQVHPEHLMGCEHLGWGPCKDDLVALSDLSVSAIRMIHSNVILQRRFCHGFDRSVWMRKNIGAPTEGKPRLLSFSRDTLRFEFVYRKTGKEGEFMIVVTISSPTRAGIKVPYFPVQESAVGFSRRVCVQVRLSFPGASGTSSCAKVAEQVFSELFTFYEKLKSDDTLPSTRLIDWRFTSEQALAEINASTTESNTHSPP